MRVWIILLALAGIFSTSTVAQAPTVQGVDVEHLVEITREAARRVEGTDPDRPVSIEITTGEITRGVTYPSGRVVIEASTFGRPLEWLILHEVAHVLTLGDGHGDVWREVYRTASQMLRDAEVDNVG